MRPPYQKYVIVRHADGRALMEGSHACNWRWGFDVTRARRYTKEDLANALPGWILRDGCAAVVPYLVWRYRIVPTCAMLSYSAWGL